MQERNVFNIINGQQAPKDLTSDVMQTNKELASDLPAQFHAKVKV